MFKGGQKEQYSLGKWKEVEYTFSRPPLPKRGKEPFNQFKKKGYLGCNCSDFRGRVNCGATKPHRWFFYMNIGVENDYLSFVYLVWAKTTRTLFCNTWTMLYLEGGT